MLLVLAIVDVLLFIVVVVLLLRRGGATENPRLTAFLAADLPTKVERLDARLAALDEHLRGSFAQLRADTADEAQRGREAAERSASTLRGEVLGNIQTLGETLRTGLGDFRSDNTQGAETLRTSVETQLNGLTQRFTGFAGDTAQHQIESREALHAKLNELSANQTAQQEKLREAVEERLEKLNQANTAKLEEMRQTVDEKLHTTLQTRMTESFGQVATQFGEVQKALGEMKELATGVGDLKKVLTNVKTRGNVGEFLLGQQLEQMFSREQYDEQVVIKPGSKEKVDYALKFPNGPNSTVLLPIDAKFPQDVGQRLMDSYEHGSTEEIATSRKEFMRAIREEGKNICDKYVDPPTTMPHAVMFLPTEGLYAEVTRIPGLMSELQQQCHVTIAGPSTFMAILTSFQMGFHTLAIERKGNEVWRVLATAKKEFEAFGGLMDKMETQVGTVQSTIQKLGVRSRAIGRSLKDVTSMDGESKVHPIDGVLPMLAAEEDD